MHHVIGLRRILETSKNVMAIMFVRHEPNSSIYWTWWRNLSAQHQRAVDGYQEGMVQHLFSSLLTTCGIDIIFLNDNAALL